MYSVNLSPNLLQYIPSDNQTNTSPINGLLNSGVLVKNRMYTPDGETYLLSKTQSGNYFLVKNDLPKSQTKSEPGLISDIILVNSPNLHIPETNKILEDEVAVFCEGSVCFQEKSGRRDFLINGIADVPSGRMGLSTVKYPIVPMSDILENRITSAQIDQSTRQLIEEDQKDVDQALDQLANVIGQLNLKMQQIRILQKKLVTLPVKKFPQGPEIQLQGLTRLKEVSSLSQSIQGINQQINQLLDPVVDRVLRL